LLCERENIWIALSEIYLDSRLEKKDFERLASVFIESQLTISEIKKIDYYEVFPLLYLNLFIPAGFWTNFEHKLLVSECKKNYEKRNSLLFILKCIFLNSLFCYKNHYFWENIKKYL